MMKELLEEYFGRHYHSTKVVSAECQTLQGRFVFADPRACESCRNTMSDDGAECDKAVFICDSEEKMVEAINLERFLDSFHHLKAIPSGKKCDLLLVGTEKIVFCDMTCSKAKYIEPYEMSDGTKKTGKRNAVKEQISNSVSLLSDVPEIKAEIANKSEKIALFAYREKAEKQNDAFDAKVRANLSVFHTIETALFQEPMFSDIGNGFLFTEIKYNHIYIW